MAVAWRGGYGQNARSLVAALAGLAVLAAVTWAPAEAARAARLPVVWTLGALALLSALSAAWTIGDGAEAIRDGAAILGLAAIVVAAAAAPAAARMRAGGAGNAPAVSPPWIHAGVLLAAAITIAVVGIAAGIATSDPLALRICDTWRPAGPFEYPPTLGLVCAGALPVALAAGTARRRSFATAGAGAAWLLALTVALTANRTAVGLAGCALVAAVWLAPRDRSPGPLALAVVASASASALVVGSHLGAAAAGRLLLALAFVALPCFVAARPPAQRGRWVAVVACAALAATAASVIADSGSGCQGDASHGRVGIWRAAVATAADRPLQGFGSGTFLEASREHQLEHRPRPTRFAHNLALEAWVELGLLGLALVVAFYVAVAALIVRAVRASAHAYLLVPYAAAFPLANLLDWPWHLLGAGMLWALAIGGVSLYPQASQSASARSRSERF